MDDLDFDGAVSRLEAALEAIDAGELSEASESLLEAVGLLPDDWEGRAVLFDAMVSLDFGDRGDGRDAVEEVLALLHDADME